MNAEKNEGYHPVRTSVLVKAMADLRRAEDAGPFLLPVDWEELGLLDYPQVIEQPMDLKTVASKLRRREYATEDDFWSDVSLVWQNCQKYNEEGSEVYEMSITMQEYSRRLQQEAGAPEPPPEVPIPNVVVKEAKDLHEEKLAEAELLAKPQSLGEEDWLQKQRPALCRRIASLPQNKLVLVIQFLVQEFAEVFETAEAHGVGRSTVTRLKGAAIDRVMSSQQVTINFDKLSVDGVKATSSLIKALRKL